MVKWADYAITRVKPKDDGIHILAVKVRIDTGDKLIDETEWTREQVVKAIENGKRFVTAPFIKKKSLWVRGEEIHIIEVNKKKFIRTDKNKEGKDNLGELPEF